jgi:hypothetical protein
MGTIVSMPSHIDEVQRYDADPQTVFAMLSDQAFIVYKSEQSASLDVVAEVEDEGDTVRIHNRRVLPAKVPGFVKRFLGDTIPLDEVQHWGPASESGSRSAEFTVDFDGQPLTFSGTIDLTPDGAGTAVRTKGALKCSVPFIGGKVENFAAEWIGKYLNKEERVGQQWLADHS